jgi:hypothetical protein
VPRWSIAASVLLLLVLTSVARANAGSVQLGIFSPPVGAPASDGSSDHTAFSQDNRDVRIVAFDSAATNLVAGDTNGRRDVFALLKARGPGKFAGQIVRVSVGSRGEQANGDSSVPSVDGTTGEVPHCVAFQSTATNLAPGAASHASSVYLRDLSKRKTLLISAGSSYATDASIDGACRAVAYAAGGWVLLRDLRSGQLLHIGRGENPDQQTDGGGVAYDSGGQVYLQRVARTHRGLLVRRGRPALVSDTPAGAPANGVSTNPAVDDHGNHVAFQSTATDLCAAYDCTARTWANGPVSDVFLRTLRHPDGAAVREMFTVSALGPKSGPAQNPAISRAGQAVVFEAATPNPDFEYQVPLVYRWYLRSDGYGRAVTMSGDPQWHEPAYTFNGASLNPSISSRGNYVAFTSVATGVFGESNGSAISDVFMRFIGVSFDGAPTY